MLDPTSAEFQDQFVKDFQEKLPKEIHIEIPSEIALAIIGNLQLALRHPNNKGESSRGVRVFVEGLIESMSQTEVLKRGLRAGFDAAYDQITKRVASNN